MNGTDKNAVMDALGAVRRNKRLLEIAEQKLLMKIQLGEFELGADDIGIDPRYAVPVSRFGTDKSARRRDVERVDMEDRDGREITVQRVRSGITRMHADGLIASRHVAAAMHFQTHFDILGYDVIGTVDWTGAGGGSHSVEDQLHRTSRSYKIVKGYLDAVGGSHSVAGQVVFWLIGMGWSNNEFAKEKKIEQKGLKNRTRDFWQGALISALETMASHYEGITKSQRAVIRTSDDMKGDYDLGRTGMDIPEKLRPARDDKKTA
jgi:hypothetical protein